MQLSDHVKFFINRDDEATEPNTPNARLLHGIVVAISNTGFQHRLVMIDKSLGKISVDPCLITPSMIEGWRKFGYIFGDLSPFIGRECFWVEKKYLLSNHTVIKSKQTDGACCAKCKEFSPYAVEGFTCYGCREDRFRLSFTSSD